MIQTQQPSRQEYSDPFAKAAVNTYNSNVASANTPPPAQTPTEFAAALVKGLQSLNGHLAELRYALFRDQEEQSAPQDVKQDRPALLPSLAEAHWLMCTASEQLGDTLRRL